MDSVEWNGGMEWNGLDWNGMERSDGLWEGSTFDLVTLQFCHIGVAIDIIDYI